MNSIKTENCIAIDFGTSNTAVYVYKQGKYLNPVYTAETYYCIPSVAVIDKSGVHVPALLDKAQVSKAYIYNAKRILGKVKSQFEDSEIDTGMFHSPLKFDEYQNPYFEVSYGAGRNKETRNIYPVDVVTEILKKCKVEAEKALDNHLEVRDCVMTIPNYFFDTSKKALKEAAERAGLNVLYFLKEPTAAGICFISNSNENTEIKEGEMVMVFDFGGGTLDLTLMVRNGNDFEVKGQGGDPNLGGTKIDKLFCDYVLQKYKDQYGEELLGEVGSTRYKRYRPDLLDLCREFKEQLSSVNSCDIPLVDFNAECDDMAVSVEEFNDNVMSVIKPRLDRAINEIVSCVNDINHVILVGGSSKIPYIHRYLGNVFSHSKIYNYHNPHTVVAEGAMRVKVNNWYHEVSESLESCLGFKVSDEYNNSKFQLHLRPGLQIPITITRYFNLSGSNIDVYRSFNGRERIEGTIRVKQAREEFGRKMVRVQITCNKDTSVVYSVYSENDREIGKLEISPKIKGLN